MGWARSVDLKGGRERSWVLHYGPKPDEMNCKDILVANAHLLDPFPRYRRPFPMLQCTETHQSDSGFSSDEIAIVHLVVPLARAAVQSMMLSRVSYQKTADSRTCGVDAVCRHRNQAPQRASRARRTSRSGAAEKPNEREPTVLGKFVVV